MSYPKITFIGGGSYQWVPITFRDIAVHPNLQGARFVLHDIDSARNAELAGICRIIAQKVGTNISVETEDDLDRALEGAQAVVLCISTGGLEAMEHDIEIPKKYGIYQPVGDSTGPGGISRTLRNVPVVTAIAARMEALCPEAWLLNLSNPMSQIVRAIDKTSRIRVIGLCHEFMAFMETVEHLLGLNSWQCETAATIVGVNHFGWVTGLRIGGRDGLDRLRSHLENAAFTATTGNAGGNQINPSHSLSGNDVKFSLFKTYGAVPYPGDRHLVEFFPYFVSHKTKFGAAFGVSLTTIDDRRVKWLNSYKERIAAWTASTPDSVPLEPSNESLTPILAALIGGGPPTIQPVTLPNRGQVANLPWQASVETMATFANGNFSPHASGLVPEAILPLLHKHCLNQELTVAGAIEGDRVKILQAMLSDPLNNNNDFREIETMLEELLHANAALLPQFNIATASRNGKHRAELSPLCYVS